MNLLLIKRVFAVFVMLSALSLAAQGRIIRGKITQSDGDPIVGAEVKAAQSNKTTLTNNTGEFAIAVGSDETTLEISAQGFKNYTYTISAGSDLANVTLDEDPLGISGVSVTAVAIKREKKSLGYATTQVSGKDAAAGKDRSVFNGLQGKVAGLTITQGGGTPGSSTRIQLRGATSLGSNQPLIVVDGIPIDNSSFQNADNLNRQVDNGNRANDINPEDVETIEVLKGPAAAVLYGSRASNGAIIITTKSGRNNIGQNNKMSLTYNTGYSWENILRFPDFQNSFGQGGQFEPDSRENFSWGPKFDDKTRPWGQEINGKQRVKPYSALPNNVKNFFQTGHTFTNNFSLNGGGDKYGYYFSMGDLRHTNPIPGTDYRRNNLRANASVQLANNFYSDFSVSYIRTNSNISTQGQGYSFYDQILQTPRDIPVSELKDLSNPFNSLAGYYGAYTLNPYYILETSKNKNTVDNILGSASLGYKHSNWLDLNFRVGTNFYTDSRQQWEPKIEGITGQNSAQAKNIGFYYEDVTRVNELTTDLIGRITKRLHKDVNMIAMVGHNIRQRRTSSTTAQTSGLVIPGYYNLSNSDGRPDTDNDATLSRIIGLYADVNFNYKDKLFLGLQGRNDWSSTLPAGKNSYFYPGANVSWLFTNTFKMPTWVKYGKFRVAAATVGKDASPYLLSSVYTKGSIDDGYNNSKITSPYGAIPGYERGNRIGNPNLKPEFTTSREIGFELELLKNSMLAFDFTYYSNKTKDIILNVPIAASTGFTSMSLNAASFTNKGIELLTRITPVRTKDFRWTLTVNYSKNINTVTEIYPGIEQVNLGGLASASVVAAVGKPFGTFYVVGNKYDGNNVVVDSTTGLPIGDATPKYYGSFNPKWIMGIGNTFKYKNWSLNILFDHREGGTIYSRTKDIMEFVGATKNTLNINGSGSERTPEVIANSVYMGYDKKYHTNKTAANVQDYWTDQKNNAANLLDATYTKLREVSLEFNMPKNLLKSTPFGSAAIGIAGRNLFLWTPKSNIFIDPETNSYGTSNVQGLEFGSLPTLRTITANLRLTF